jgi:hypothetical protein
LLLYGESDALYRLESTDTLFATDSWNPVLEVPMTNSFPFLDPVSVEIPRDSRVPGRHLFLVPDPPRRRAKIVRHERRRLANRKDRIASNPWTSLAGPICLCLTSTRSGDIKISDPNAAPVNIWLRSMR